MLTDFNDQNCNCKTLAKFLQITIIIVIDRSLNGYS